MEMHSQTARQITIIALLVSLSGLNGCFNSVDKSTNTTDANASGSEQVDDGLNTTSGNADTPATEVVKLGRFSSGAFVQGELDIGLATVSAGGSTGITATLVDGNDNQLTDGYEVFFNSSCISQGLAEISSPVSSVNGVASATYVARGCSGQDVITARVTANDQELNAQGELTVEAAELGSIEFVSATPTTIALRGMGGAGLSQSSTVVFRVLNAVGGPVASRNVDFSLSTSVGGLKLQPESGLTDASGFVQTVVESGDVHTSVRVKATVTDSDISTQSSQLVVSTGVPDQDSMSLAFSVHNPEAWSYNGVEVDVIVHASDRFNNPVPDGTTISFYTELGQIQPSCQTEGGTCTAKWVSSNPKEDLGRSTVVAAAIGEETFIDTNGDGAFDDGDVIKTDTGEAYEDWDESAAYESGEQFLDYNVDAVRNGPDGLFTGLGCADSTRCATDALKHVFTSSVMVLAESNLSITDDAGGSIVLANGASQNFVIQVGGLQWGQVPPAGTVITAETDVGQLKGNTSYTMPSSNGNSPISLGMLVVGAGETEAKSGVIKITATTPRGVSNVHLISITEQAPGP
ncbi:MAG: hypothetical protein ACWA44_11195 [Thiotrichales bacterium]